MLLEQGVDLSDATDSEDLFESGRLDSLALFHLALWIEEKTGEAVDLTEFDLRREWASERGILAFVSERDRRSR
jgi:acyl carrier protein